MTKGTKKLVDVIIDKVEYSYEYYGFAAIEALNYKSLKEISLTEHHYFYRLKKICWNNNIYKFFRKIESSNAYYTMVDYIQVPEDKATELILKLDLI